MIGYKFMRYEDGEAVSGADSRLRVPLRRGNTLRVPGRGIFLSLDRQYVEDYYSGLHDDEVLLTLSFDEDDIVFGNPTDRETELGVSRVRIEDFEVRTSRVAAGDLPFFSTCVSWPREYMPALFYIIDKERKISRRTFLQHVDKSTLHSLEEELGYFPHPSQGLTMAQDWAVGYYAIPGFDAYHFDHSRVEHVFATEDTIRRINEKAVKMGYDKKARAMKHIARELRIISRELEALERHPTELYHSRDLIDFIKGDQALMQRLKNRYKSLYMGMIDDMDAVYAWHRKNRPDQFAGPAEFVEWYLDSDVEREAIEEFEQLRK